MRNTFIRVGEFHSAVERIAFARINSINFQFSYFIYLSE